MKTKIFIASIFFAGLLCFFLYPLSGFGQVVEGNASGEQVIYLFHREGCSHCTRIREFFSNTLLPENSDVKLVEYEIYSEENRNLFDRVRAELGISFIAVPVTVIGRNYVMGFGSAETSGKTIESYLEACRAEECADVVGEITQDEQMTEQVIASKVITNQAMYKHVRGRIVLKVEDLGRAYYINPTTNSLQYLGSPDNAFAIMRQQGIGISNTNLEKIRIGLGNLSGTDTDKDGLPDIFEDAIGTDKNLADTDGDGITDKDTLEKFDQYDDSFADRHLGKIFLQVESHGEAWYINPADGRRYFLGRPSDAFNVMRNLGLGISNSDFDKL